MENSWIEMIQIQKRSSSISIMKSNGTDTGDFAITTNRDEKELDIDTEYFVLEMSTSPPETKKYMGLEIP